MDSYLFYRLGSRTRVQDVASGYLQGVENIRDTISKHVVKWEDRGHKVLVCLVFRSPWVHYPTTSFWEAHIRSLSQLVQLAQTVEVLVFAPTYQEDSPYQFASSSSLSTSIDSHAAEHAQLTSREQEHYPCLVRHTVHPQASSISLPCYKIAMPWTVHVHDAMEVEPGTYFLLGKEQTCLRLETLQYNTPFCFQPHVLQLFFAYGERVQLQRSNFVLAVRNYPSAKYKMRLPTLCARLPFWKKNQWVPWKTFLVKHMNLVWDEQKFLGVAQSLKPNVSSNTWLLFGKQVRQILRTEDETIPAVDEHFDAFCTPWNVYVWTAKLCLTWTGLLEVDTTKEDKSILLNIEDLLTLAFCEQWKYALKDLRPLDPIEQLQSCAQTLTTRMIAACKTGQISTYWQNPRWVQSVQRHNVSALYAQTTRVISNLERSVTAHQLYQYCPIKTPDDEHCGKEKDLALFAHTTTGSSADIFHVLLQEYLQERGTVRLCINGCWMGYLQDAPAIHRELIRLRRQAFFDPTVTILLDDTSLVIDTSKGRMMAPYQIPHANTTAYTIAEKFYFGQLEYLTRNEALQAQPLDASMQALGILAAQTPFARHNAPIRNVMDSNQRTQAIGLPSLALQKRLDAISYRLLYLSKQAAETGLLHLYRIPWGTAITHALNGIVMHLGNDMYDAFQQNVASVQYGLGAVCLDRVVEYKPSESSQPYLDPLDGLPYRHTTLLPDATPFGKMVRSSRITKVMVYGAHEVKVKLSSHVFSEPGNKITHQNGQKRTCSTWLKSCDQYFDGVTGTTPDIQINPSGIKRLTISDFFQSLMYILKHDTVTMIPNDSFDWNDPFPTTMAEIQKLLKWFGLVARGQRRMYHPHRGHLMGGIHGSPYGLVTLGINPHMTLCHLGAEKLGVRGAFGPKDPVTTQPIPGITKQEGSARFGDMEKDCLLSYSSRATISEIWNEQSDLQSRMLCTLCGNIATFTQGIYKCLTCAQKSALVEIALPGSTERFLELCMSQGVHGVLQTRISSNCETRCTGL